MNMNTEDLTLKPQRRALQYFYVDGAFEFGFGLLCLILALYFCLEQRFANTGIISAILDASLILVLLAGDAIANHVLRWWKERFTYPRTGYLAYRRPQSKSYRFWRVLLGALTGGLVGAVSAILLRRPFGGMDVMPALSGILLGLVFMFLAWRVSLLRLYLLAILSILSGGGLAFARLGNFLGLSAFYLVFGGILLLSGLVTLIRYLRQNPSPIEAPDEQ